MVNQLQPGSVLRGLLISTAVRSLEKSATISPAIRLF